MCRIGTDDSPQFMLCSLLVEADDIFVERLRVLVLLLDVLVEACLDSLECL